jgi:hypothetical protein
MTMGSIVTEGSFNFSLGEYCCISFPLLDGSGGEQKATKSHSTQLTYAVAAMCGVTASETNEQNISGWEDGTRWN